MATDRPGPLAAAAARKHDATLARAGAALRELDRAGGVINFQAVARAAGVSRQWLYQQPDLRREIEQLRSANAGHRRRRSRPVSARPRRRCVSASGSLLDENHRLRGESDETPRRARARLRRAA